MPVTDAVKAVLLESGKECLAYYPARRARPADKDRT